MRDVWSSALRDHLRRICAETEDIVVDENFVSAFPDGKCVFPDCTGFQSGEADKVVVICEPFLDVLFAQAGPSSFWSSMTTGRQIFLSEAAWRDAVLIPFQSPHKLFLPPIRLPKAGERSNDEILLIDHAGQSDEIDGLLSIIRHEGFRIRVTDEDDDAALAAPSVHLHVGEHTRFSHPVRILDSWASHRIVVQLRPRDRPSLDADAIMVDDGTNGFLAHGPADLLSTLQRVTNDAYLFDLTTARAHAQAQGLQRVWDDAMRRVLA